MDKWECVDDDDAVEKYWSTRKQMIAIYAKYMPEKVADVGSLMGKHLHRWDELVKKVEAKYLPPRLRRSGVAPGTHLPPRAEPVAPTFGEWSRSLKNNHPGLFAPMDRFKMTRRSKKAAAKARAADSKAIAVVFKKSLIEVIGEKCDGRLSDLQNEFVTYACQRYEQLTFAKNAHSHFEEMLRQCLTECCRECCQRKSISEAELWLHNTPAGESRRLFSELPFAD